MATNRYNSEIGIVDSSGNLNIIYPSTRATNVAYKSTNVDTVLTNLVNSISKIDVLSSDPSNPAVGYMWITS